MKIFVVGSLRRPEADQTDSDFNEQREDFEGACRALGRSIAAAGHEIVLCSGSESTVDPYVLQGARDAGRKTQVFLYRPDYETLAESNEQFNPYAGSEHGNVDLRTKQSSSGWRPTHLSAIKESDAVIAVGGSQRGTGSVMYSAEILGKPTILIPSFGRTAEANWKDFARYYSPEQEADLQSSYSDRGSWAERVLAATNQLVKNNTFSEDEGLYWKNAILVTSLLVCISLQLWQFQIPPSALAIVMLLIGAIAGGVLRNIMKMRGTLQTKWNTKGMLPDVGVGIAFGLLAFILTQSVSYWLSGDSVPLNTIEDGRRVGIGWFLASFAVACFQEEAWDKISERLKTTLKDNF